MLRRKFLEHAVEPASPPDSLAKLLTTAQAIEDLRDVFAAEAPLDEMAARVANSALAATPHADIISITVLSWPDSRTAACTDEEALVS